MNYHLKSKDKKFTQLRVNTGVRNIIDSKTRKMFSDTILSYSLTGNNKCELCRKRYMLKDPPRHQHTIQGRENVQMPSLPNKTVRKTSELSLNRKQNASEAQLSQV